MVKVYPVILSKDGEGYVVRIPDFRSVTEGKNLGDAIFMARDAIGLLGIELEDEGKELPEPYSRTIDKEDGDIETLVDVDFTEYRMRHDNRTVRKNCTIPYYLNAEAEKRGFNFSKILQEALAEKVGNTLR
ncbi:MAG: type II toxin-antitoxin system HicB family antitoxin [Lachnospiraceae bacterium]|nr:type II toxin-antitoxin system HicB family antitoxin [Lachnospiraceae bacterium]